MISSSRRRKSLRRLFFAALFIYLIFVVVDIEESLRQGSSVWHLLSKIVVAAATIALGTLLIDHLFKIKNQSEQLESKMKELEQEYQDWKKRTSSYIQGLTEEIDEQLSSWQLSPAEKEIALLLLKGFTNKEIAGIRSTSEHTIKQQASAVYRKSGLKTRAEISAFFLGDLLPSRKDHSLAPTPPPQTEA